MIVGIPTRNRPARSAGLAAKIARVDAVSSVGLVYDGPEPAEPDGKLFTVDATGKGLKEARNFLLEISLRHGADSYQVDDDVEVDNWDLTLGRMASVLEEYPYLGAVCTIPWFYWGMGWKGITGHDGQFAFTSAAFQCWAIRREAIQECGYFDLETAEDLEYGYRLWSKGWGVARLTGRSGVHKVSVGRLNKSAAAGGQPVEVREAHLPVAFEALRQRYPGLVTVGETKGEKRKATHYQRPNWPALLDRLRQRWGSVGYTDSRGWKV
jgi:hypothetical protein